MPTLTLLVKAHSDLQLKHMDRLLQSKLEGLEVQIGKCKVTPQGWVQATISGEDEVTAQNYLASEIGLCPVGLESVIRFSTFKGQVVTLDNGRAEVSVDIGVFSPESINASIPLGKMQSQLVDGRKLALAKIAELFGLCKNLPLTVKILDVNEKEKHIQAGLAEKQLSQYRSWTRLLLDRLIVLNANLQDIQDSLKRAGCERDIIDIETLSLVAYAVVCKLGTDAVGLIPKIGKSLRHATFSVFSPRRIVEFLGDDCNLLTS